MRIWCATCTEEVVVARKRRRRIFSIGIGDGLCVYCFVSVGVSVLAISGGGRKEG